jgi:aminoglycoside 6'-N-acetyltransferase
MVFVREHPQRAVGAPPVRAYHRCVVELRSMTIDEESHYWGDIQPGTWALDIWIGSPEDRGRGLGAGAMKAALRRVFDRHDAEMVVIDPAVDNRRAIAFYEKLGFERVGVREFGDDECLVMRLLRSSVD